MKKIKSWIYRIVYIVIFFALCKTCITDHINGSSPTKIKNLETMISDNTTVQAELSNEYKEKTIKIMGLPVKTYECVYNFQLDNKSFSDKISLKNRPTDRYIQLYYLKSNPKIVSQNPQADLENEKKKDTTNANLYWGILWGILGLLGVVSTILKIIPKSNKIKKEIPKTEQKVTPKEPIVTTDTDENKDKSQSETENQGPQIDKEDHSRFMPK